MQSDIKFTEIQIIAMPEIEVEKMLNVLSLRKQNGFSQFELSFLMGQRDFYVRDVEDPMDKLTYGVHFANIFRQIFNCDFKAIVPNINSKPAYQIRVLEAKNDSGQVIYRAEKQVQGKNWKLIAEFETEDKDLILEVDESVEVVSADSIQDWVLLKIETGYFDTAKTALQIFKDCKADFPAVVRPVFLARALKSCNGTKGLPKLNKKKNGDGWFVYGKD